VQCSWISAARPSSLTRPERWSFHGDVTTSTTGTVSKAVTPASMLALIRASSTRWPSGAMTITVAC